MNQFPAFSFRFVMNIVGFQFFKFDANDGTLTHGRFLSFVDIIGFSSRHPFKRLMELVTSDVPDILWLSLV